jgi:phosphate starvation-inducible PhoH-like protein
VARRKTRKERQNKRQPQFVYKPLTPKTDKQAEYIDAIKYYDQVVCLGPAGAGKSYIASTLAAEALLANDVDRIVLTRPNIPTGPSIGALPGSLEDKFGPWAAPILDTLEEKLGEEKFRKLMGKQIQMVPTEYIRGRSFERSFIIVDEAANLTIEQIKALLTRQGEGSTMILNGDVQQNDLGPTSGLSRLLEMISNQRLRVPVVEFNIEDIVRSASCKMWVKAFLEEGL